MDLKNFVKKVAATDVQGKYFYRLYFNFAHFPVAPLATGLVATVFLLQATNQRGHS